jgi:hypothetical protein
MWLVYTGADGRICVLDTQQGYLPVAYLVTHCTDGACLAISSDGRLLAAAACSPETNKVLAATDSVMWCTCALLSANADATMQDRAEWCLPCCSSAGAL